MAYFNGKRILSAKVEGLYDVGYAQGKTDGMQAGYTDGYSKGKTDGYTDGHNQGMRDGYEGGYAQGEADERNAFWDKYQTGTTGNIAYRFAGYGWTDETYNPIRRIYTNVVSHMAFCYAQITDTKVDIEIHSASNNVFQSCSNLKTIRKLIVSDKTAFSSWFAYCYALENITFEGEICSNIDLHWSEKLTRDSLLNIIHHLATVSTTQTLTLGAVNLAKLADAEKKIAEDKGWILA